MKLELKHLAPYLPYKLEFWDGSERYTVPFENTLFALDDGSKPILHPLSDLTNGDLSPHGILKTSEQEPIFLTDSGKCTVEGLPYSSWIKLIELHYDVFGLIPEGLAIDINTI